MRCFEEQVSTYFWSCSVCGIDLSNAKSRYSQPYSTFIDHILSISLLSFRIPSGMCRSILRGVPFTCGSGKTLTRTTFKIQYILLAVDGTLKADVGRSEQLQWSCLVSANTSSFGMSMAAHGPSVSAVVLRLPLVNVLLEMIHQD